eukprot:SAG31_NODE_15650_length_744_cov_1.406202_1_plen_47_part_10
MHDRIDARGGQWAARYGGQWAARRAVGSAVDSGQRGTAVDSGQRGGQ